MNNDPLGTGNFIQGRMPGYTPPSRRQPQKKKGFWQDQISTGGATAGAAGGAAIGSVGGPIGALAGAIIGGALGGFSGQRYENAIVGDELNKDVAQEAALGGAFAVGPLRALKVAGAGTKAAVTGGGVRSSVESALAGNVKPRLGARTGEMGVDLRRNVANTTKVADSFTEEKEILESLSRAGLKGSASQQYKNLDGALGNISDSISAKLTTIQGSAPKVDVLGALSKNVTDVVPSTNQHAKELSISLQRLTKNGSGDHLTPSDLFRYKQELGQTLAPAFKKIDLGGSLTPKEEVNMALWRNLDGEITKLAPDVKRMTLDQSNLIKARPGLQASSQKTLGIPLLGVKSQGAERVAQNLRDGTGRLLSGSASSVAGEAKDPMNWKSVGVRSAAYGGLTSALTQEQPIQEDPYAGLEPEADIAGYYGADEAAETGATNPFGVTKEEAAQAMIAAMQEGNKNAYAQAKDLYEMISEYEAANAPSQGGGKPKTVEGQKAYNNAVSGLRAVDDLEAMLAQDGSLTWKSSLPGGSLTDSLLGASQYETARGQAIDAMTRLTTGAALTKQESDQLKKRLPQAGDSPETVAYKLAQFRTYFNEVLNQPQGGTKPSTLEEAMMGGGY